MVRKAVERVLAERIGLDPGTVGKGLLTRALHARMSALGLGSADDYGRLLDRSDQEQEALVEEVVVAESWFFRDERPFQVFRDQVVACGWGGPSGPPLRVLSIPCAAGEEPYSILMVLLDLGVAPARATVVAVDVSARVLETAARGIYRENAFRGSDLSFRSRYFQPVPQGYALNPEVRTRVRFVRGNLLDPDLLRDEPPYHAIFCRNLLIYLDADGRRRALENLDRRLAPGGLLFLGHAEHPGDSATRFEPVGDKGGFAYRRASTAVRGPSTLPAPAPPVRPRRPPARPAVAETAARPAPPPAAPPPTPPLPKVSQRIAATTSSPRLAEAAALAGQGRNEPAAALCAQSLRDEGPNASAFFLLGMIHQAAGDPREAEASLQKAVYLDPQNDEALLALAFLAERRGDEAAASGYRRRATRAHRRKGTS